MGLLNLLYLTSMPTEHKNKYFVKCRYGKYFLCVSKGYKNDLPRSLRSTPFKSPDRALIVYSLYKLFDNKRYKLKLKIKKQWYYYEDLGESKWYAYQLINYLDLTKFMHKDEGYK